MVRVGGRGSVVGFDGRGSAVGTVVGGRRYGVNEQSNKSAKSIYI